MNMTRLILTTDGSAAFAIEEAGRADIVIPLMPRLVWGPLPSDAELAAILAARSTQSPVSHWLDYASSTIKKIGGRDLRLIDLCQRCEAVELWMGTEANAQLVLIWLFDYLHPHAKPAPISKLIFCHLDARPGGAPPQERATLGI